MFKKYKLYLIFIILVILGFIFYPNRIFVKNYFLNFKKIDLPKEISQNEASFSSADLGISDNNQDNVGAFHETSVCNDVNINDDDQTSPNPPKDNVLKQETLPAGRQVNLKVPFTIQSPDQKWDEVYKEGCEEASILMVYSFLNNKSIAVDSAMKDIGNMINLQNEIFGGQYNLSATTTAYIANKFFELQSEIVILKSIEDVKRIVSNGNPLILPTLGRELKNPNFKEPGPIYHMLVVKGYTKSGDMITNDPGTRKGKDYLYNPQILFNAIGDWDYNTQGPNANIKVGIILK